MSIRKSASTGLANMGAPIPLWRKSAALDHVREMIPDIDTGEAMEVIGEVSGALERDDPYRALQHGMKTLDLTGAYRLMAVLLTEPA